MDKQKGRPTGICRHDGLRGYGQPDCPARINSRGWVVQLVPRLRTELDFPGRDLGGHGQSVLNLQLFDFTMAQLGAVAHQTQP